MTDSMKFGPEWLRNMSTDSTANISQGSGGSSSGGGGVGGVNHSSNNLSSSVNLSGGGGGANVYHYNNSSSNASPISTSAPGQRNLFPQFRYGREELLSLFDKDCNMPEILPGYKKLFVEKVQVPLALNPSTDEEIFAQTSGVPTQRPAWLRRSPVGFTPSLRGTGRGGSVDRGRLRGKSVYHPIYQRPTPMFEDEVRPPLSKPERSWSERNGAGDTLVSPASIGIGSEWNGTPASSPRKEFSSHSRNMENWRKNRSEDGSGDATTSGIVGTDGWRGSTSFGSTHRWGRSTSWRDDESVSNNSDGYIAGSGSGSGITMQRSYSTISTTVTERGGYGNNIVSKSSSLNCTPGFGSNSNPPGTSRQVSNSSGPPGGRGNQWTTATGETDDNLPEWAMENPSDGGGTFDASGAFHGSANEEDSSTTSKGYQYAQKKDAGKEECPTSTVVTNYKDDVDLEEHEILPSCDKSGELSLQERVVSELYLDKESSLIEKKLQDNDPKFFHEQNMHCDEACETEAESKLENISPQEKPAQANSIAITTPEPIMPTPVTTTTKEVQPINSHIDLSDRMQEVADDMVEKLIMDDDSIGIANNDSQNIKPPATTSSSNINMPNAFVAPAVAALLKQTVVQQQHHQQTAQNIGASPSLPNLGGRKVMPLFGGGIVVDHATMQQHNLQQQQLAAAASATANLQGSISVGTSEDLWFYRDPQSKVQGPFTANEMTEWYRAGYFDENLYVRRICDARFRALGELIKLCHGNMPFTHTHLIPVGLDNVSILPNSIPIRQVHEKPQGINEFCLNHQSDHCEELKGNVMAAADSLSAAVKNLINPVDMSHMLNMHFQMLQEQYVRHQEMMVVAEFSNKECFQRLTPSEREAAVRQKVQMLGLPEYLTSLAGLSNSLSTLNPTAGNQLYDVIAECSKKDQQFVGGVGPQSQQQPHQAQQPVSNTFLDPDDFVLSTQKQQQTSQFTSVPYSSVVHSENASAGNITGGNDEMSTTELINDFNLRMLLRGGNINSQQSQQERKTPTDYSTAGSNDFLTQQQLLVAASHSPALQMWIPQMGTANNVQQQQFLSQQTTQPTSNQWTAGTLVQMMNSSIPGASMANISHNKAVQPPSMWDVLPLDQVQNPHQFQSNVLNFSVQPPHHRTSSEQVTQKHQSLNELKNFPEQQINPTNVQQHDGTKTNISSTQPILLAPSKTRKEDLSEKQQHSQHNAVKRDSTRPAASLGVKTKEETRNNKKPTEEEKRREQAEEKRRQKEEKKRQQAEEDKRRAHQIEEEKRRQVIEEKERQQQIQVQRRKAMLGNSSNTAAANINTIKPNKEPRVQSSIAPWSAKSTATSGSLGPSLAEIQKAERRERRADQRQMEMLEKQLRVTNAATAEINDSFLKWNASPVPVKSFAEIQAEEAKRLSSELLDMQRRKDQAEQSSNVASNIGSANINPIGSGINSTNLSAIWSGSKVWGSTSNAGFWEEPIKFSAALATNNNATSLLATTTTAIRSQQQSSSVQQKSQLTTNHQQNIVASTTNRNLIKSQTVSTMQNNSMSNASSVSLKQTQIQKQPQQLQQKSNQSIERKGSVKNQTLITSNNNTVGINKKDDYQNEFTGWCMKSLSGMNTKVDVPTFVAFLQDLESPYEVKDYVRMYLGEGKEYTEFAKQFLERRSKYKNMQRAQNAHNDDMCKPAPAITPSGNDSLDNRGKPKKVKKSKMTKLDARILGFSVTAAEGRINVGDRDYADAP